MGADPRIYQTGPENLILLIDCNLTQGWEAFSGWLPIPNKRGKQINSTGQLRSTVASLGAGTKVTIEYVRNKKQNSRTVELGQLPENLAELIIWFLKNNQL